MGRRGGGDAEKQEDLPPLIVSRATTRHLLLPEIPPHPSGARAEGLRPRRGLEVPAKGHARSSSWGCQRVTHEERVNAYRELLCQSREVYDVVRVRGWDALCFL